MLNLKSKLLAVTAALLCAGTAFAQDSGPLIEILLRKGIINDTEAEDLRAELVKDFVANTPAGKLNIASTVTGLRLAGDVRIRYQYDNEVANFASPTTVGDNNDRARYRYRFRFAPTISFTKNWSAGFRLETANGATSTNDDFGGAGSTNFAKDNNTAFVGQAFVQYATSNWFFADRADFRIGKHAHTFFNPGINGFWIDSDINFEGFSEDLGFNDAFVKGWNLTLRGGQYVLAANSRTSGKVAGDFINHPSAMWVGQAEYAKTYLFENNPYGTRIAPTLVVFTAPEITGSAINADAANYDNLATFILPIEHTIKFHNKPLGFYATYGMNFKGSARSNQLYSTTTSYPIAFSTASGDPKDYDTMYNLGVRYGAVRNPGDWLATLEYRSVEAGAYTSILLDSDFNAGRTNGDGFIASLSYNWTDAIGTTVTYFSSRAIDENGPAALGFKKADVLQIDLTAKF
jgi:hypothetical protein